MPLLFSYGSLREESVQLSTFGRRLAGQPDTLRGFAPDSVPITDASLAASTGRDTNANARFTGLPASCVEGAVLTLTDDELVVADEYEKTADYLRIAVVLASGRAAWVYVDARSAPDHLR